MTKEDADIYYKAGFETTDEEVNYLTGSDKHYTYQEVHDFVHRACNDLNRYHFLIFHQEILLGEIVFTLIHETICDFRIALFKNNYFNRGYGTSAIIMGLDYLFQHSQVQKVSLEVYAYNPRAMHVYKKLGFCIESTNEDSNEHRLINMILDKKEYINKRSSYEE